MAATESDQLSPQLLHRLVEAFPGGIAYLGRDLIFSFCNDIQASYFGLSTDRVVGRSLHDVVPDNPEFWQEVERVASTGTTFPQTALAVVWSDRANEGEHHYLVSYIADRDPELGVRGVFMTALEITEAIQRERDVEAGLREQNRILEETVKERDLLVGIVSHELRTPLTTIFGNAHMLLRRLEDMDVESRTQAITDIREEAARLNGLVENMLLLARAGVQAPVPTEPILVKRSLDETAGVHRVQYPLRALAVSVKPASLMVDGQPQYMQQVVQNLLNNAEKYSPGDSRIDLRARRVKDGVVISIQDRGSGIAPQEAEIIFQAFYRSDNTSTKATGAGIGLAVCKLLVQAQSGRIWARPRRGGGSVFSFTLPSAEV
jgi:signal transduction histidine kinase